MNNYLALYGYDSELFCFWAMLAGVMAVLVSQWWKERLSVNLLVKHCTLSIQNLPLLHENLASAVQTKFPGDKMLIQSELRQKYIYSIYFCPCCHFVFVFWVFNSMLLQHCANSLVRFRPKSHLINITANTTLNCPCVLLKVPVVYCNKHVWKLLQGLP